MHLLFEAFCLFVFFSSIDLNILETYSCDIVTEIPGCMFLRGPFCKRKDFNTHSQGFLKIIWSAACISMCLHCFCAQQGRFWLCLAPVGNFSKKREIIRFIFPLILFQECFMLLQRVCVLDSLFSFAFFSPFLSKFHLCFPSRICEKYFQYISLNGFLVLILLPRHLLLTAFGNRILGWMALGLTQYSCFYFLKC